MPTKVLVKKRNRQRSARNCLVCSKIHYKQRSKYCSPLCTLRSGDFYEISERIRKSKRYRVWRKTILSRDKYTCVNCGKSPKTLEVDHIIAFRELLDSLLASKTNIYQSSELWNIDNGRTLCPSCHRKTDSFGSTLASKYKPQNPLTI